MKLIAMESDAISQQIELDELQGTSAPAISRNRKVLPPETINRIYLLLV
jgi:hypothetical protein